MNHATEVDVGVPQGSVLGPVFAHLAKTLLKDEESARDNHVLACNFADF